jgi:hypothetical protein
MASAQEEYIRYHTDAELLAQAEQNMRQREQAERQQRATQMARAETPAPPQPKPQPPAAPEPAPKPAPEPTPVAPAPTPQPEPAPTIAPQQAPAPKPAAPTPPPAPRTVPAPAAAISTTRNLQLDILWRQPTVDNALAVLRDVTQRDELPQVEAVRILCARRPAGGEQELYVTAFTSVSPFVREAAISALLQAYADESDTWARRLLETRGGRPDDRYEMARIVLRNQAVDAYPLAIEALAEDYTGQTLFDSRHEILQAGPAITGPLTRVALRQKGMPNGFVARRLYRWVQDAGGIREAYYDTFFRNEPETMGVALFRERYGQAARPLLNEALNKVEPEHRPLVQQALADLDNPPVAPVARRQRVQAPAMVYLITYDTSGATHRILTDTPIWPEQSPGDIDSHTATSGSVRQKAIGMSAEQIQQLRQLSPSAVPSVQVDGQGIDRLDMR